jgi:hypothetical protein
MLGYLLNPALQLEDINGMPLVGGWLTVYRAGTTFPYITCRDFDMNRNPVNIVLDEKGMAVILAEKDGLYDVYAYDRNGVQQWSRLNVCTIGAGGGEPSDHKRCVHRLLRYYTNAVDADETHPVGDWLHDLDGIDPEDPSGYPMVRAEDLFYWLSEGQIFVLYEVDSQGGIEKWNAQYQLCTWQDQSEWWSQDAPEPGKAVRIEFVRLGAYSEQDRSTTPYCSNMIAYIRYRDEEFMRLYELKPGQSVWTAEYQEKLPYYSSDVHNGDFLRVKIDGSALEWAPVIIPTVNDAVLTIQKNGSTVATFSANSSTDKVADITVPTKGSDIQNDLGWITSSALPTVGNGTLTIQKNGSTVQSFTANSSSNKTANITVPTKTSDITNDSGFITSSDLPTVGNGTITIKRNSSTVGSFTVNQSGHTSINLSVPTKTSDLQNDSDFITSSDLPSVGNGKITVQKNGSTVDSFTVNQSSNKTINISVPTKTSDLTNDSSFITLADVPECNLYVATYNVSTFNDVLAAYNAGKAIILTGADFGSNIHTQMLMYDFNTSSGQTRKFQFAPTVVPRVAAYYKYYATLDETNGWSKDYFSNTVPTKCGGIFQLSGDETAHNLIEHRGWLCNGIYNFDLKFFCSANACNIYLSFVDQAFHVDVVGMRRGIRNDRMASIDQTTTVQTLVRDIDVSSRIVMTEQPLNATNQRIDIATLGPQELSNYNYDIYWDLDLIFTQWGVTGSTSPCYHLHIEKFGQPSAGHSYLFATLTGSDLY